MGEVSQAGSDVVVRMVNVLENLAFRARQLGLLPEGEELVLLVPDVVDGERINGYRVMVRPKVRKGEGPLSHPAFIVDGGMLGSDIEEAFEKLRSTVPPLAQAAQARAMEDEVRRAGAVSAEDAWYWERELERLGEADNYVVKFWSRAENAQGGEHRTRNLTIPAGVFKRIRRIMSGR